MFKLLKPKNVLLLLCLLSGVAFSVSCFAEHVLDKRPCQLCIITRYLYVSIAIVSYAALKTRKQIFNCALTFITFFSLIFGYYHLGVESHWWAGPSSCVSELPTLENLTQAVQENIPYCDKVNLTIFGVSSTLWNVFLMSFLFWLTTISQILTFYMKRHEEQD